GSSWGPVPSAPWPCSARRPRAPRRGFYTFSGTLPQRSGKQLLYAIWQRSDSPEAFYSCSDVSFGGSGSGTGANGGGTAGSSRGSSTPTPAAPTTPAPTASAPSSQQIAAGADKSTVEHHGHGDADASTSAEPVAATNQPTTEANEPQTAVSSKNLAETGANNSSPYLIVGGAASLALGAAALFASVRRRATNGGGRHGR
ncbi:lytic polysaccharide monooxygenase, partial [Streptomyces prunicolor]|uniref:lytic polysaccharide monooxygenase n=1 Tax=Streptomyces prunicolor TaxID=67348 RepID=UPI0033F581E9